MGIFNTLIGGGNSDKDILKEQSECVKETVDAWQGWLQEADADERYKLGDQWTKTQRESLKYGAAPSVINFLKKPCDTLSGIIRTSRPDITAYPVENADDMAAEVYSSLIKWIMTVGYGYFSMCQAADDAFCTGIGWLSLDMNYDRDFLNGDIVVRKDSPFRILLDPKFTQLDMSDVNYILRKDYLSKSQVISLYPSLKEEIDKLGDNRESPFYNRSSSTVLNSKGMLNIVEKWYKEYQNCYLAINTITLATQRFTSEQDAISYKQSMGDVIQIVPRSVPIIKLLTTIEDKLIAYNDVSPLKIDVFPFVPLWGYADTSFPDIKVRHQGVIRQLKEIQNQTNKTYSQMMRSVNSLFFSKWFMEKGSLDKQQLVKSGQDTQIIEYEPGMKPPELKQINDIPNGLVQLIQMTESLTQKIGINYESMGMIQENNSPGIAIQLRQNAQNIIIKTLLDNFSLSNKMLGNSLIKLTANWSIDKIKRIVGNDTQIPNNFEEIRKNATFDVVIDEQNNSPTYRFANYMKLQDLASKGLPIDPETLVEASDLPSGMKEKVLQGIRQQKQMQQGAQGLPAEAQSQMPPAGAPEQLPSPDSLPPEVLAQLMGNLPPQS